MQQSLDSVAAIHKEKLSTTKMFED